MNHFFEQNPGAGFVYGRMWWGYASKSELLTIKLGRTGREYSERSKEYQGLPAFAEFSIVVPNCVEFETELKEMFRAYLQSGWKSGRGEWTSIGDHFHLIISGSNDKEGPLSFLQGVYYALRYAFKDMQPRPFQPMLFESDSA